MMAPIVHGTKQEILGVPIDALKMEEVLDRVHKTIVGEGQLRIPAVNAARLVKMRRDPTLQADVPSCNLILANGVSIVWASRLLGRPLSERLAGIDLMFGMLGRGSQNRYTVYCLGTTDGVLAAAVARITTDYWHVRLVGRLHGYSSSQEQPGLVAAIADAKPDILLVGMRSPKKDSRPQEQPTRGPRVPRRGWAFDALAGMVRRAPSAWQRLGLEWLYRVKQEPRRLWHGYLITNSVFWAIVAWALLRELPARLRATPRHHSL